MKKLQSTYDLLLLDIETNDAMQLVSTLRGDVSLHQPVIVLLTFGSGGYLEQTRKLGIASTLSKPFNQDQLYQTLTTALGSSAASGATVMSSLKRRPRVLVVDDNEINQIAAVRMLEKLGVDSEVAETGIQAIAACQRSNYDLVLMDCEMPEMDGFGATAAIRAAEVQNRSRRLPIVAITANAIRGEREKCLAAGMDEYMAKPIRFEALRQMMAQWSSTFVETLDTTHAVDFTVLDEIRDIDEMFAKNLIDQFVEEVGSQYPDLHEACSRRDPGAISGLGHRLRGSCLAVGANGMAEICAEIEQAAQLHDFDRCTNLAQLSQREFERVRDVLEDQTK
jgi:CheY-like chemotaxis protein/HPt (histidine-containing phosphotransfer) domain-containing protein